MTVEAFDLSLSFNSNFNNSLTSFLSLFLIVLSHILVFSVNLKYVRFTFGEHIYNIYI